MISYFNIENTGKIENRLTFYLDLLSYIHNAGSSYGYCNKGSVYVLENFSKEIVVRCESGLHKEQVIANGWDIPARDFLPETLEEQLICFADKFYSKTKYLHTARTFDQVVESMAKISDEAVAKVKLWAEMFM